MEKDPSPLYTVYFAGLGGSLAKMSSYQPGGVVETSPVSQAKSTRGHLPDHVCLPPVWTGPDSNQVEPWDLLTTTSLGLDPRGWLSTALTWPYALVQRAKTGTTTVHPTSVGPLWWRLNVAQVLRTAPPRTYSSPQVPGGRYGARTGLHPPSPGQGAPARPYDRSIWPFARVRGGPQCVRFLDR